MTDGTKLIERLKKYSKEVEAAECMAIVWRLAARGYCSRVLFTGECEVAIEQITGGDPSCPHPKYFDPSDGHGYTEIRMDDVPDEVIDDLDECSSSKFNTEVLRWMERHVLELEGKPIESSR